MTSNLGAANLLQNPGFEDGLNLWEVNTWGAGPGQVDNTVVRSGAQSCKWVGAGATPDAWQGGRQLNIVVDPSKFYQYSAWVNVPTADSGANKFGWTFRHNIGAGGADIGYTLITAPGWTQVKGPILQLNALNYYGFHTLNFGGQTPFYVDDCAVEELDAWTLNGKVVDAGGTGVDGATVTATGAGWTSPATTTAGGGTYSIVIPGVATSFTVSATTPGMKGSVTHAVAGTPSTAPNIVLATDPDYDTDLIFSARSAAYTPGSPWPVAYPGGQTLTPMGAPGSQTIQGAKWEKNVADGDGFLFGTYSEPIVVNGASVVVAVRPKRVPSNNWDSVVDVFYDRLVLGVRNDNGQVNVRRNGSTDFSTITIPEGQVTILSLVVQPTGEYKVWANGTPIMTNEVASDMTALIPNVPGPYAFAINVGRNNPDAWTTFNGNIGDVYLYKVALDDAKRTALENSLRSKFGPAAMYTITVTAGDGGAVTPGTTTVPEQTDQSFTITPNRGFKITDVVIVDGGVTKHMGAGSLAPVSYIFANVTQAGSITATFERAPAIKGVVSDVDGPIKGATVTLSANPSGTPVIETARANAVGEYELFPNPPVGTYYLIASASVHASSAVLPVTINGADTTGHNFVLAKTDPSPLINLSAAALSAGEVTTWTSTGRLPAAFKKFDGGTGPTAVPNYMGTGRAAVEFVQLTGDPADRRTMVADIPTPDAITGSSDWTVSTVLFRMDPVNGDNAYLSWSGRDWGSGQTAQFCYRDNLAYVHWGNDSGFAQVPGAGDWHTVTITYDGTEEKLYVDGILQGSASRALNLKPGGLLMLGGATFKDMRLEDQYWRFNGAISSLKIWDQALSATEVAAEAGMPVIHGKVKKADGTGIANAIVQVGGQLSPTAAVTDSAGRYAIAVASVGTMEVYADALGYGDFTDGSVAINGDTPFDIVLTPKLETGVIQNGGFETITAGKPVGWTRLWLDTGADWSQDYETPWPLNSDPWGVVSPAPAGSFAARYAPQSSWTFLVQDVRIVPGSTYNCYFKAKADAGITEWFPLVAFRNDAGEELDGYVSAEPGYREWAHNPPKDWKQYLMLDNYAGGLNAVPFCRMSPPIDATRLTIWFGFAGTSPAGKAIYVDDVVVDRVGPDATFPPAPVLNTSMFSLTGGVPSFNVPTSAGYRYRVVYKAALEDPAWLPVVTTPEWFLSDGANLVVTDQGAAGKPARFYRVEAANQ